MFSNLPQKIINDIGTAIYELLTLLPENTFCLVHDKIDVKQWGEAILVLGDLKVRELYKVMLNKVIFVYIKYYGWQYHKMGKHQPTEVMNNDKAIMS